MPTRQQIEQDLLNANVKITDARCQILELMHNKQGHYSAEEIHAMVTTHNIGLATVYRTLTQLEAVGLILRHSFLDGVAVYEINDGDHGHVVCVQCRNILEFDDPELNQRQTKLAEELAIKTVRFSHTIYGICSKCSTN